MKILIVGMSHSIHTARWINQFKDTGWDIHLFPSVDRGAAHAILEKATVHHSFYYRGDNPGTELTLKGVPVFSRRLAHWCRSWLEAHIPGFRQRQLQKLIKQLQPDLVHSMAVESASYLTLQAKQALPGAFPPWLVSNWGNDLYFFGRLSEYKDKVSQVMPAADHYSCESKRDAELAKEFGFTGVTHPYIQAGGGWDLQAVAGLRQETAPSKRKIILVKGYQNLMGRTSVALRALERCKELLDGYEVVIFGAIPEKDVRLLAEWFTYNTGVPSRVLGRTSDYSAILKLQAQARVFIGLSISDGVSNSFLESLLMGSFPIQSYPSNTHEWIQDGVTGISVTPEDPEVVERALRKALTDDLLVDRAAEQNWQLAQQRLDAHMIRQQAIEMYEAIADSARS